MLSSGTQPADPRSASIERSCVTCQQPAYCRLRIRNEGKVRYNRSRLMLQGGERLAQCNVPSIVARQKSKDKECCLEGRHSQSFDGGRVGSGRS